MMDEPRDRVQAQEPTPVKTPAEAPAAAAAQEDAIDSATAGDGVTFFERGDGREEAQGDIERNG